MGTELRAPTVEDCLELARNMRRADELECRALGFQRPEDAVLRSYATADFSVALVFDGKVAAVGGLKRLEETRGLVWLLTSNAIAGHHLAYHRAAKKTLAAFLSVCPRLEQYIDARYTACLRWLVSLGWSVSDPAPYGVLGMDFCRVTIGGA
jgi:hypothetical protein